MQPITFLGNWICRAFLRVGLVMCALNLIEPIRAAEPVTVKWIGSWSNDPGVTVDSVLVTNGLAYLGSQNGGGLVILDVSDPAHPVEVGQFGQGFGTAVQVAGDYIYFAHGSSQDSILEILQLTKQDGLISIASCPTDFCRKLTVLGNYAYVPRFPNITTGGMLVFDIHDPANPFLAGSYSSGKPAFNVSLKGTNAYVARLSGMELVDVSQPTNPVIIATFPRINCAFSGSTVVFKDHLYVPDSDSGGLKVIDISAPASPTMIAIVPMPVSQASSTSVALQGHYLFVSTMNGFVIFDIGDPTTPIFVGEGKGGEFGSGLAIDASGCLVYLADVLGGLQIYKLGFPWHFGPVSINANQFEATLSGEPSSDQVVAESSPDLNSWTPVATNSAASGIWQFSAPLSEGRSSQFYRAVTR